MPPPSFFVFDKAFVLIEGHPPVAVSSEDGAVMEVEVEAGEAVHGLPQEEGGPD
jgi:hypothetical protein